jgi:hypothetical protein
LALGACERDELATPHGLSPSKVPTVASAFGPKRGSMLVRLSIIGAFAAIRPVQSFPFRVVVGQKQLTGVKPPPGVKPTRRG